MQGPQLFAENRELVSWSKGSDDDATLCLGLVDEQSRRHFETNSSGESFTARIRMRRASS